MHPFFSIQPPKREHPQANFSTLLTAATRLAERLHDAHPCPHCRRPSVVDDHLGDVGLDYDPQWCPIAYDPASGDYRHACRP